MTEQDQTLLVGVLSDTHGRLPLAAYAELADCDHIIHAGDICGPEILEELSQLAPVSAVLGNNDYREYGAAVDRFATPVIGGVRFLIAHRPEDLEAAFSGRTCALKPHDPLPQVAIHGHTHVPRIVSGKEASPASWLICPGSVSRPRRSKPSVAKIEIAQGAVRAVRLVELRP